MAALEYPDESVSQQLLAAALGGLLCVASSACSGSESSPSAPATSTVTSATFECDGGVSPDPSVTTSTVVALTLDMFTSECTAQSGLVEIQPHCGGLNLCRGMSYDTETQTLTQHSCRATNTCAGYTCIICD